MSRTITPHKGGRTTGLFIRITPEAKERLERICKETGQSQADVIAGLIKRFGGSYTGVCARDETNSANQS